MSHPMVFYAFAFLITLCSVMVVSARNPVTSAIFLVADLFLLAGVYGTLNAHFIAAIQVLVYAGAIVVLFMFVIMLLNLSPDDRGQRLRIPAPEFAVLLLTVFGFVAIGALLAQDQPAGLTGEFTPEAIAAAGGNTYAVGMVLFTRYIWPFELASILILLAIVAAVVIAKKDKVVATQVDAAAPKGRAAHGAR